MSEQPRNLLMIGVDAPTFAKVAPMLERDNLEVDRFPRARASFELLSVVPFETLMVAYPLPDMAIEDFLHEIRREGALSKRTPLLLLTTDDRVEEASRYVGRGANRAVSTSLDATRLQEVIAGLLAVAPRVGVRVMASLEIHLEEGKTLAMCQTENLSATGMLIRTHVGYPIGSHIRFEFGLPGDPRMVRGEAEVVRHTLYERESVAGVGVRFLAFDGDGLRRFQVYLDQLAASREMKSV